MSFTDSIIIYLACGSPFGVYYFVNTNRSTYSGIILSFLITIVWIPYSLTLLQRRLSAQFIKTEMKSDLCLTDTSGEGLIKTRKAFEDFLPSDRTQLSLFELREVLDRYVGLSLAGSDPCQVPAEHEKELYTISNGRFPEVSALCLNRRNRSRLLLHQTYAREDFLKALKILLTATSEPDKLYELAIEFVRELADPAALGSIQNEVNIASQTVVESSVGKLEKEIWIAKEQKQSNATRLSIPL
jgi:hypothetical protein